MSFDTLNPAGPVGQQEVRLIVEAFIAMLIVVIPAILLSLVFAWRYRISNRKARYDPEFRTSPAIEITIWTVPLLIIIFLSFISWRSTHALDPFRRLDGSAPILHIQVVALDWKWLFIYPGQHVASVNELVIPVGTQLAFDVTSNGAMNAFFVPRLGTQIYAMAGMRSQVHLLASQPGTFRGISANFSGAGFPDMRFVTRAVSPQDFAAWLKQVEASPPLDATTWAALKSPSQNNPVRHFADVDPRLFNRVLAAHGAKPMAMTP